MAGNKNVSNLATTLAGDEFIRAIQRGLEVVITPEQIKNYVGDIPDGGEGVTESQMTDAILVETNARIADVQDEEDARIAADAIQDDLIADETAARIAADSAESTARASADATLTTAVANAVSGAASAIATEVTNRNIAIAAEAVARDAAILVETAARIAGDNAEASARGTAITAAISALKGAAPTNLDTLVEIAAAIENDPNFGTTLRAYADAVVAAQDAMVFKGVIDCSSNPNYPAANCGWTYRISVAGKIGGALGINVLAGDVIICMTDGTVAGSQGSVGANWAAIEMNLDGALTTASIGVSVQAYAANLTSWAAVLPGSYLTTIAAASAYQPLDSDLTAWAAVNPGSYLNAAAIAAAYQPLDSDLTAWAAVNPASYLNAAGIAAAYQPLDADLTAWAAVNPSAYSNTAAIAAAYVALAGGTMTGALQVPAGAVGTPGLRVGDADTGYFLQAAGKLSTSIDGVEMARMSSLGLSVGVGGGFDPAALIHARAASGTGLILLESNAGAQIIGSRFSADAGSPVNILRKGRGSISSPAYPNQNDGCGNFNWQISNGTTLVSIGQIAGTVIAATPGSADGQGRIEILTTAAGASTPAATARFEYDTGLSMYGANVVIDANRIIRLRSYTVGTLPSAAVAGMEIYVSNESGGAVTAFSDGTNWRRSTDRAIVT